MNRKIEHARMTTPPNASKIIKLVKYLGFSAQLSPLQHNCQKDNIICTEASKIAYPAFAYCTFDITSDDETANITARII
jgi:hypothetical protein